LDIFVRHSDIAITYRTACDDGRNNALLCGIDENVFHVPDVGAIRCMDHALVLAYSEYRITGGFVLGAQRRHKTQNRHEKCEFFHDDLNGE